MLQGVEMRNFHSQETGRSMVEMLGVLAIVGVLSVGGIAGYSQAMSKFKVTKAMDQVQTIITNIRTLYASQRTYTAIKPEAAQAMGILTEESINGSKGLNPFGGEIQFGVGTTAGTGRSFTIAYTGLTPEACVKMATADWGADQSSGLLQMRVGTIAQSTTIDMSSGTGFTWGNTANPLPVQIGTASTLCDGENPGFVLWEYR